MADLRFLFLNFRPTTTALPFLFVQFHFSLCGFSGSFDLVSISRNEKDTVEG